MLYWALSNFFYLDLINIIASHTYKLRKRKDVNTCHFDYIKLFLLDVSSLGKIIQQICKLDYIFTHGKYNFLILMLKSFFNVPICKLRSFSECFYLKLLLVLM